MAAELGYWSLVVLRATIPFPASRHGCDRSAAPATSKENDVAEANGRGELKEHNYGSLD